MQFSTIVRNHCLRKTASNVATGFVPLSEIKTAVLFADGCMKDCEATLEDAHRFFSARGISLKAFALCVKGPGYSGSLAASLTSRDINWFGRIKTGRHAPKTKFGEDLFISLLESPECFAALQAASSSRARFKLGRFLNNVFDVAVSGGEGAQQAAFKTLSDILSKVSR